MSTITPADTLTVLAVIKSFHGPQDLGEATITAWHMAFTYGRIANLKDAEEAVVRHYSTPGANPWITPGDVIGQYKELRWERIKDLQDGQLTPDLPGDAPMLTYVKTTQARAKAVENGMPIAQAIATVPVVAAIEAPK